MVEQKRAEFQAPAQQAEPSEPHRERIRAEKIFLAEARVFRDRDGIGRERGPAPEGEIVAGDFDGTAEHGFQARGDFSMQAAVLDQQGNRGARDPQEGEKEQNPFRPAGPRAPPRRSGSFQLNAKDRF